MAEDDAQYKTADVIARLLGLTRDDVQDLASAGVLVKNGRDRYHLVGSVRGYVTHLREMDQHPASQLELAEHLGVSDRSVREILSVTGLDHKQASRQEVRDAYISHLRAQASGHQSSDGYDLVRERVMTERVERELKELQLAEKRRTLINVAQIEPELAHMFAAFKAELINLADNLKADIDQFYGTDIDAQMIADRVDDCLTHLSQYQPGERHRASNALVDDGVEDA